MKLQEYLLKELNQRSKHKVTTSSKISSLGIDSLDLVEIVVDVEEKFNVVISDDKLETLQEKSVSEIIKLFTSIKK
jgi:acyl carrier protein